MIGALRRVVLWFSCIAAVLLSANIASAGGRDSYVAVRISGAINPVKVRLLARALAKARSEHAEFLLVTLDTPGGLVTSMNEMVTALTNATVPVVTYVSPRSAQASSAGAFILLAGDLAAMAPGTRTGAAHPVGEAGKALEGPINEKLTNSLSSLIISLAGRRGRPTGEAEAMVRQSTSYTAEQALGKQLIEIVAPSEGALLSALDERKVADRALRTRALERIDITPTVFDQFLDQLADPALTALFLSIGMLALLYELATPGIGAGGAVGALLLVLGLLSSSVLPVELSAVVLLVIGAAALALEVKLPTHGVLGGAGVLAILLGSLLLVDQSEYFGGVPRLKPIYALPVIAGLAVQLLFVARSLRKAMAAPLLTGIESLVGRVGEARSDFVGNSSGEREGVVFVDGARWNAVSDDLALSAGQAVTVVSLSRQPTRLRVRRII
jgi:membrane-bound serine protease (ClpP class)